MNQTSKRAAYCPIFEREGNRFILLIPACICNSRGQAVAAAARIEVSGLTAAGGFRFTGEVFTASEGRRGPVWFLRAQVGRYPALVIGGPLWEQAVAKKLAVQTG